MIHHLYGPYYPVDISFESYHLNIRTSCRTNPLLSMTPIQF